MINVPYTRVASFWDCVHIDEIKTYSDSRGLLSEVFRIDDDLCLDMKQCYISETLPFVARGPHQHSVDFHNEFKQTDNFYSWKNRMVYYLYNPDTKEGKHFITDPTKIYRVTVPPPIIHSYRNIDTKLSNTLNFPTALFKGTDKKFPIDEVRHEHKTENNRTYIVLGAGGRLGKAITNALFENMGDHTYDVIPVFEKLHRYSDIPKLFDIFKTNPVLHNNDVVVINCIGLTTKCDNIQELEWGNVIIPNLVAQECLKNSWKMIHFSSDYVYREDASPSNYTISKIKSDDFLKSVSPEHIKIFRIANLFSDDIADRHNFIAKFSDKIQNNEDINIPFNQLIMPTSVDVLSSHIVQNMDNYLYNISSQFNFVSSCMTLKQLLTNMFGYDRIFNTNITVNWYDNYIDDKDAIAVYINPSDDKLFERIQHERRKNG